jgi:tetratricopeptide (TPR) repeat protein
MTGEQAAALAGTFARAREAYGAGDWAACRAALEEAHALDPDSMELKRWQARLAYREGDWQGLSDAAQAYLAFHPQDREMAQLCARGFSNAKQWSAATLAWQRVAELRPDWPEAWLQLARAQLRGEVPHLAAASARRLSELAGTDAILAAARLAIERGQMAEAAEHFARLAAEAPERGVEELRSLEKKTDIRATVLAAAGLARGPQGETYKGIARSAAGDLLPRALGAERRGRTLDAHLDYAVLAQVEPDDMIAKTGMRRTLQTLQDDAKERAGTDRMSAQKAYLQILFLQPGDTRALTALGQIAMAEQDWGKASELWSALLAITPGDIRALVQNARALDRAHDFTRATAAWRGVLAAEPANTEAQLALSKLPSRIVKAGREAVDTQRYVDAVALFSAVPPDSPEHETTLRRLDQVVRFLRREMRAAYKTRHFEQVVRYGTAAVSVQPDHEDLQRLLAQSAMRTRDYALAAEAWSKAVALSPPETRGAAILHLARCRLRLGETEESRALVAGLLRDEPENADAAALAREIAADIQSRGAASPTEKDS